MIKACARLLWIMDESVVNLPAMGLWAEEEFIISDDQVKLFEKRYYMEITSPEVPASIVNEFFSRGGGLPVGLESCTEYGSPDHVLVYLIEEVSE